MSLFTGHRYIPASKTAGSAPPGELSGSVPYLERTCVLRSTVDANRSRSSHLPHRSEAALDPSLASDFEEQILEESGASALRDLFQRLISE